MPHYCSASGCTRPVFAKMYCAYHQYMRKQKGGDLYGRTKPKASKQYKIPQKSKQRKEDEPQYKQIKDEIRTDLRAQGKYNCIFCTKPMGDEFGFHHLKGRVGKDYIDRKYLQPAHNECHVEIYHRSTVEQLKKLPWYEGFLERLKAIDIFLWEKEMRKHDKAQPISVQKRNLTLFDDN